MNSRNSHTTFRVEDDGAPADIDYDGLRRPVQLRNLRSNNSLVVGFNYTYDRMNNKLTEGKQHSLPNRETYTYDSAYRLRSFNREMDGITPLHRNWTLDGAGNWKQVDGEMRQHSSFNEITLRGGVTVLSDDSGNETNNGTFTFQWDFRNRLSVVVRNADSNLIGMYSYDADGRRIRKIVTNSGILNGTTDFYLDAWQEIEERDALDALVQQFVFGANAGNLSE